MKVLNKFVSDEKKMALAFGLMDTINANIIEIAKECISSNDREYCEKALSQFVKFDENTCRAIEYMKHEMNKDGFGNE